MAAILIVLLEAYRRWLSPFLGPRCRFYPSCSAYALACLRHDPLLLRALGRITRRVISCNPFHPGGVDLP